MTASLQQLRELANCLRRGDPHARVQMQQELLPGLAHVIRHTLRRGGETAVAHWLGRTLGLAAGSETAGPDAQELASLLCKEIACQLESGPPRPALPLAETIVGTGRSGLPCPT